MGKIFKNKVIIVLIVLTVILVIGGYFLTNNNKAKGSNKVSTNIVEDNIEKENANEDKEDSLQNKILDNKYEDLIEDNSVYTKDLEVRNNTIAEEYGRAVKVFKSFAGENSLNLTYEEPIEHRISRFSSFSDGEVSRLLENLYGLGAETVNYFTDEVGLNIDLSIGNKEVILKDSMESIGETYSDITYKASIENIDSNFNFETSKLNEFRNMLISDTSLDYGMLNDYISKVILGEYNKGSAYLNKINEHMHESITIKGNNCYYKIVYNPLL